MEDQDEPEREEDAPELMGDLAALARRMHAKREAEAPEEGDANSGHRRLSEEALLARAMLQAESKLLGDDEDDEELRDPEPPREAQGEDAAEDAHSQAEAPGDSGIEDDAPYPSGRGSSARRAVEFEAATLLGETAADATSDQNVTPPPAKDMSEGDTVSHKGDTTAMPLAKLGVAAVVLGVVLLALWQLAG